MTFTPVEFALMFETYKPTNQEENKTELKGELVPETHSVGAKEQYMRKIKINK